MLCVTGGYLRDITRTNFVILHMNVSHLSICCFCIFWLCVQWKYVSLDVNILLVAQAYLMMNA